MSFAAPLWLIAGAVVIAALALALRAADARRRRDLERFAARQLLGDLTATASPVRRLVKRILVLVAVGLVFLSLAGPEVGFRWEETRRRGVDVLIAVDVSRSMLARDVQPNRLRRAKLAVDDLVARLGGDRVGLIAFAGTAFLQCPLTLDHAAFHESLEALEPGIIPAPGSDIGSAIGVAEKALETEAKNVKLLVLLSDGEDLRGDAVAAAEQAAKAGVKIFTVGVGTPAGELIPVEDEDGKSTFVKDAEGRIVKSRLDEKTLRRIAEVTGGFYVPLGRRGEGIQEIALRAIEPIPRADLASRLRRVPENRYQWPLAAALLLLVIEPFIGERRREPRARRAVSREAAAAGVATLALLGALFASLAGARAARAESPDEAARLYEEKSYAEAATAYRKAAESADDPRLDYNQGAAAYRAGAYADAAGAFAKALRAEDESLRERAFYDLGNAQFRVGEQTVGTSPDQTIAAWKQAIDSYDEALRIDEKDADAKYNKELVKRRLEELQKQQQQQPQDQQQDQQKDDEQKQDQKDQPQDQQEQDRQQSEQDDEKSEQEPQDGKSDDQKDSKDEQKGDQPKPAPSPPKPDESGQQGPPKEKPQDEKKPPESQDASGKPQEKPGEKPEANEPPQEAKVPGRMSPSEARELLDSLRGEEEAMPLPMAKSPQGDEAEDPRNW